MGLQHLIIAQQLGQQLAAKQLLTVWLCLAPKRLCTILNNNIIIIL